jgi:hypothetical protein
LTDAHLQKWCPQGGSDVGTSPSSDPWIWGFPWKIPEGLGASPEWWLHERIKHRHHQLRPKPRPRVSPKSPCWKLRPTVAHRKRIPPVLDKERAYSS